MTTAEKNYQDFLELSAWLTANTSIQRLQDRGADYFGVLLDQVGRDLSVELLAVYRSCRAQSAEDGHLGRRIGERLLSDPKLGPVTKNVRRLWERGEWQSLPSFWRGKYGMPDVMEGFVEDDGERVVVR